MPIKDKGIIWRTKDGKLIPVKEMQTAHLMNCIHFIHRRVRVLEAQADSMTPFLGGESMASYYVGHEFHEIFDLIHGMEEAAKAMQIELEERINNAR
jgi:hypothetical protein